MHQLPGLGEGPPGWHQRLLSQAAWMASSQSGTSSQGCPGIWETPLEALSGTLLCSQPLPLSKVPCPALSQHSSFKRLPAF